MAPLFRLAALIIAFALFPRGEARAQTKIANDDAGFSFVVPAGYQRAERLRKGAPYALYEYATDLEDVRATTLLVSRMEGPIRQGSDIVSEHLKMPFWVIGSGPRTGITETWKGFDIPAVRMASRSKTPSGQIDVVTFDVLVPLRVTALRVIVTGPQWEEATTHQTLQTFLTSLDGDTNWSPLKGDDVTKLQSSVEESGRVLGKLLAAVLVALAAAWWLLRRARAY